LIRIPTNTNISLKFVLNDIMVVSVPEPTINGNAIGTIVPESGSGLKILHPVTALGLK
jgi:hypothetical protein